MNLKSLLGLASQSTSKIKSGMSLYVNYRQVYPDCCAVPYLRVDCQIPVQRDHPFAQIEQSEMCRAVRVAQTGKIHGWLKPDSVVAHLKGDFAVQPAQP